MNTSINFELAKLLKEKGFDENTRFGYNGAYEPYHLNIIEFGYLQRNSELLDIVYSAPTIAEVVMWLCEKHGIWITTHPNHSFKYWSVNLITNKNAEDNLYPATIYNSPTEAYEAAIEWTLIELI